MRRMGGFLSMVHRRRDLALEDRRGQRTGLVGEILRGKTPKMSRQSLSMGAKKVITNGRKSPVA